MKIDKSTDWSIYKVDGLDGQSLYPNTPYISPVPGKIPLVGFNPVPDSMKNLIEKDSISSKNELLRVMKYTSECGCNSVICGGTLGQTKSILNAVSDLAKGVIVSDELTPVDKNSESSSTSRLGVLPPPVQIGGPELGVIIASELLTGSITDIVHLLDSFRDNTFVKGWFIMDEPHYWDWGNVVPEKSISAEYNRLTLGFKAALMYGKGISRKSNEAGEAEQQTLFTLPASNLQKWLGTCKTYKEYLEVINLLFRPSLWTYKYFPVTVADKTLISPSDKFINHSAFYTYLSLYRAISTQTGTTFWACCQANSLKVIDWTGYGETKCYPIPDLSVLRFSAFSALAYGAQGLIYSRLGTPNPSKTTTEEVEPIKAAFDYDAKKGIVVKNDDIFNAIKTVNKEIEECSDVFLGSVCEHIEHAGELYSDTSLEFPFGCIENMTYSSKGTLCARLKKDKRKFVVLVNHEVYASQKLIITISAKYKIVWQYATPDGDIVHGIKDNKFYVDMAPGGVVIFEYENNYQLS